MGGKQSSTKDPVPNLGDVGYVALVIYHHNKMGMLHCPRHVIDMVHNTIL